MKQRDELVKTVRKWGGLASEAVLDPACQTFTIPNIDGFIGYRKEHACAVVLGNPICPNEQAIELSQAFDAFCRRENLQTIYLSATGWFADFAIKNICSISVEFGDELFIDPHDDPRNYSGHHGSLVRRKVRHAEHEGVTIHEYIGKDPKLEQSLETVRDRWLKGRRGLQVHISQARIFEDREGRRWFYAEHKGKVVGLLVLNRLEAKQGWLLNHLIFVPDAPHGTPEHLVTTALKTLDQEGCHFVSFGNAVRGELGKIIGLNGWKAQIANGAFKVIRKMFSLDGKHKFWEKFHPSTEPSYLLFSDSHISLNQIFSLRKALNMSIYF